MLKLKPYSVLVEDAETKEQIPLTSIKGEQGLPGQPGRDGRDGQPGQDGYTPVKGVDYYTDAEKSALETEVQGVVESNIQGTLDDIQDKVYDVEAIAKGRSAGYVFDTEDAMTTWVAAHSDELNLGDNLYIRATNVPDYWWDGTLVQPLETQKVDLTEYAKTSTVNTELGKKQDKLTAGTNITISGTTISAKSDSTKQDKLTAGTNITISGTTISAKSDATKQDKLISGTTIKTVNGESLLGSGNIEIKGGGSGDGTVDSTVAIDVIPPSSDPEYINVQNELDGIKEDIANIEDVIGKEIVTNDSQYISNLMTFKPDFPCSDYSVGYLFRVNSLPSGYNKIVLYGIKDGQSAKTIQNGAEPNTDYKIDAMYDYIRVYATYSEKTSGTVSVTFTQKATEGILVDIDKLKSDVADLKNEVSLDLTGKKISILGVSIDTYGGWIPAENVAYYTDGKAQLPNGVEDTWWKKVLNVSGATLLKNNSYTGACATTNGKDYDSSGVKRCLELSDTAENPDIILIGMFGANDWVYSECGTWDMAKSDLLAGIDIDLSNPTNYAQYQSVIETYSGAMATIFYRLQEKYPNARIFALDMYNYTRSNGKNPPRRSASNKTYTIGHYNKALKDVADYFGVTVIHGVNCGINAKNSVNYTVEGEGATSNLHPNASGHELIYKSVINALKNAF